MSRNTDYIVVLDNLLRNGGKIVDQRTSGHITGPAIYGCRRMAKKTANMSGLSASHLLYISFPAREGRKGRKELEKILENITE